MPIRILPSFLRRIPIRYLGIGVVIVIIIAFFGIRYVLTGSSPAEAAADSTVPHVQLASVADLSANAGPLSLIGTVTSEDQATVLAETSGEITSLPHQIGAHVSAGEILGQFENSSQEAAVTQAEGAYEAARAALEKATSTTATNSGISSANAAQAAANASASLRATLRSAYASLDDAVHTRADTLFTNPRSATPQFVGLTVPDAQLVINIENTRSNLENTLNAAETDANADASADMDTTASALQKDTTAVGSFLDNMIDALNQAVPNSNFSAADIAAYKTSLTTARSEVSSSLSSITAAKSAYDNAVAGAVTAGNSATSGTDSDIAAAEANLKSAKGALESAEAALAKTIVRSPISGTIISLPVTQGDFVSAYSQIAVVSNPGALYVDTQVTPDDAKTLTTGATATINGTVSGIITSVAPAIDPSTGKIDVKVAIKGNAAALTDGESVPLELQRSNADHETNEAAATQITIPIEAVKMLPQGSAVFTVTASSTLEPHAIELGSILGDRVVVVSGLTNDMQIVSDARGLTTGGAVIVDNGTDSMSTTTVSR